MKQHSIIDLAYAAGIIDGEGSLGITEVARRPRPERPNAQGVQHRIYLAVTMVDAACPLLLCEMFGGHVGTYQYNEHRPQIRWSLSGSRAADCCEALMPYLRLKRQQAELVIRFQREIRGGHRGARRVTQDELAARRAMVVESKALNARRAV